ncbi:MAG: TRAP transporter large permease subunit [Oscillibacter sp.]|nr:TRAP transporter large permease subunit [Oscillibacter sp.]MEA4994522.1 TRAP transporter large permease subunit [Oscillibacter sp.]
MAAILLVWALLVPVIIPGGIYGGIFTPTESAVVATAYSLIADCFIDNISSCVILTPILLPIVTGIGMDPIHFGIVMTVNLAIGFITPPYGCNLFFASAISDVPVTKIAAKSLPMILIMIGVLMLLTFIHALSIGALG